MIRALLFDMGGTLDGDGVHWLERFLALYQNFGVDLPREAIRDAFDEAEHRALADKSIVTSNFAHMIALHVQWQLTRLGLIDSKLEQHLVEGFIAPVRETTARNARLLATLAARGFEMGVVSNGCGNVDVLCHDFGYTPFLSIIVDSRRVGLFKPDPAIFLHAIDKMGHKPGATMMVGDSFERDVVPAKSIGMKTAWIEGEVPRKCSDPSLVDLRLRKLSDLPAALSEFSPALT